jgi:replicative DNA helicase
MSDVPPIAPPPSFAEGGSGREARDGGASSRGEGIARGADRVPPHSLEAEVSVLGACLISASAAVTALEHLTPEAFYRSAHRVVFEAIHALASANEPVDAVTVTEWLSRHGRLDEVGGAAALYDLTDQVPTAANAAYYARIVRDRFLLRRLVDAGGRITSLGYEPSDDAAQTLDRAETIVYDLAHTRSSTEFTPLSQLLNESFELIEKLAKELNELLATIDELEAILADPRRILAIVREDTIALAERFGDDRKTAIVGNEAEDFELGSRSVKTRRVAVLAR